MNILFLHTTEVTDAEYLEALKQTGAVVAEFNSPALESSGGEAYVKELLSAIESANAELVFSLGYYPLVSVACKAMGRIYAARLVHAYCPELYSCTLLNDCNRVFIPDRSVYRQFASAGFSCVFWLPLSVPKSFVAAHVTEDDSKDGPDACMMQDIKTRDAFADNPLSNTSPLMDASKGYLEGCIACRHQLRGLPSMTKHLPSYVKEELLKLMPPVIAADSVETPESYYDNRFFNPLVTAAAREFLIRLIGLSKLAEKVELYSGYSFNNPYDALTCFPAMPRGAEFNKKARQSKLNLYIPHENWVSGIPQREFDIMAAGGFVLTPFMADAVALFEECMPEMYFDRIDTADRVEHYLKNPAERVERVNAILDMIKERHTTEQRVEEILGAV